MKLISYLRGGTEGFGAVVDADVIDLTGVHGATALVDLLERRRSRRGARAGRNAARRRSR